MKCHTYNIRAYYARRFITVIANALNISVKVSVPILIYETQSNNTKRYWSMHLGHVRHNCHFATFPVKSPNWCTGPWNNIFALLLH